MTRIKQITGRIVLGVMTLAVAAGAAYALWLGVPLLNPGGERFGAGDIPIINTDTRIVRPMPSIEATSQEGVIKPGASTKPEASVALGEPASKHRSSSVARASSPSGTDDSDSDSD